jgi:hypothetical protein
VTPHEIELATALGNVAGWTGARFTRDIAYAARTTPERDTWPASRRDLGAEFEKGRVPTRSLAMMDKRRQTGACRICTL